jgi:hypothetical protein
LRLAGENGCTPSHCSAASLARPVHKLGRNDILCRNIMRRNSVSSEKQSRAQNGHLEKIEIEDHKEMEK